MANTRTAPRSTATIRSLELAGQLDLMRDKTPLISDFLDDATGGIGPSEIDDTNGAIGIVAGSVFLTKAGVAAMTLAAPVAADNGKVLRIIATTANAHTVTCPAATINAASAIGTFGGAAGDNIVLVAYNLKWYVVSKVNVTLS